MKMNKKNLLKSFQDLKSDIESLRKRHLVQGLVDKFHVEKKGLEKRIEKTVVDEMKKAKKFMTEQKKELNKIQKKVEAAIKKRQASLKKTSKKVTKKVAKATTKKVAKKATKKASSKR